MHITKEVYAQQRALEESYDKRTIFDKALAELLANPFIVGKIEYGARLLQEWVAEEFYEGKSARVAQVALLDLNELATLIITEITISCSYPTTLVSISAMCARLLKMADKPEAIQTMGEVISVLRGTELFSIAKPQFAGPDASYMVKAYVELDGELAQFINNTTYLPPMIHRPKRLRTNRDSGYITQAKYGDSLILGGFNNHHEWDICLDVLNIMNSNEFELDEDFLQAVDEPEPKLKEIEVDEAVMYISHKQREAQKRAIANFPEYVAQCRQMYDIYLKGTNSVFFTHKVDKRGRIYTCGFHLSPQGNSYKKGMLNSKKREIPTGITSFMEHCK